MDGSIGVLEWLIPARGEVVDLQPAASQSYTGIRLDTILKMGYRHTNSAIMADPAAMRIGPPMLDSI